MHEIMIFMTFDSKVDSCISPNNNYSKNNSRFQQNSLMDGLSDASKKKNIKNIAESTLITLISIVMHTKKTTPS